MQPIRVLVVDDAAVLRRLVTMALTSADGIDVVGTAGDGWAALDQVERLAPDLVVMDLEMPELDGIGAVHELRRRGRTTPVIMVSAATDDGAEATLRALAAGATDFFPKPSRASSPAEAVARVRDGLVPVVRALVPRSAPRPSGPDHAAPGSVHAGRPVLAQPLPVPAAPVPAPPAPADRADVQHADVPAAPVAPRRAVPVPRSVPGPAARAARPADPAARGGSARPAPSPARPAARTSPVAPPAQASPAEATAGPAARGRAATPHVLALGSSTGGPEALARLIAALPADLPVPVVITQHMPPVFTRQLAVRLDRIGALAVREAEHGDDVRVGRVLVAPGDRHLQLRRSGGEVVAHLSDAAPVNFCRPAVDVMLRSCVDVYGAGVLAVVLTGMGSDGRDGCADVRRAGGAVLVQDAETSVVWGMPGAVAGAGLADAVLPLDAVAGAITAACRRGAPAVAGSAR
ncbi:chemotaxis-specific protein-glutamate methyltransferase CheB [uncultured Pseudokineococcus sp.]|uniref:chemotaxis-specific protein-glutamate methyltransferase CheB n=1 Tax=uncultured Pseudokineococcus sp. TaxID=1642928 RepID=UPI002626993B|nr:chemotaxis-specific protein-glutamate methyltransferase CheB [uncultured Pseudokineococcus sp.]